MSYQEIYEVRYTDHSGKEVTQLRTSDKNEAMSLKDDLLSKGYKQPHIQYSFKGGGPIIGGSFPIGFRPEFLETPILYGKEIQIKMPNGESRRAKFAIVELDQILASHNEKSYGTTVGYPLDANGENVNDRNYTGDVSSQAKIIEFSQGLEPDRLITTSRTPSGTPIITIDGIVVSGNNRTMSLKLAVSDYPEKYKEYLDFLIEEITAFGFKEAETLPERIMVLSQEGQEKQFIHPILVRIDYDFPEYNALELSKYNKDTKKSERPIDKALKLGKMLESSEKCTSIISNVVGKYETFSEFYASRSDQKAVKDTLIDCNILTTQEIPAYFSETGFTEQGKELIENLLAGLVLSKDALIASNEGGARIFRQTIITSLPVLTANKALPENSLNDAINEALIVQSKMSSSKTSFKDLVSQTNIFGEQISADAMYLNRLLASGRNNFKRAIEGYNASVLENQGESLFGEKPTKEEIFEAHIKNKIDAEDRKTIENVKTPTTQTREYGVAKDHFEVEIPESAVRPVIDSANQPTVLTVPFAYKTQGEEVLYSGKIDLIVPKGVRTEFINETWYNDRDKDWSLDKLGKIQSFDSATPAENYELLQFSHPPEYIGKKNLNRMKMLEYWDKHGEEITKLLGLPTQKNYPYINLNTGSVYTMEAASDVNHRNIQDVIKWWSLHDGFRAIAEADIKPFYERLEILKNELVTAKTKAKKAEINHYNWTIDSIEKYQKVLLDYINSSVPTQKKLPMSNPFINGNYFKEKPENILAVQTQGTDRWKKPVTEYKGSLEDVKRIEAPLTFLKATEKDNPLLTVIDEPVTAATDTNTSVVDNLTKAAEQSQEELPKKKVRKSKAKAQHNEVAVEELVETYTVQEVWDMVNPEISKDELRAFMWWKHKSGRPIESQNWLEIAEMTADELYNTPELVDMWIRNGQLYYFDGELLPAYLYLAENVYDKKNRLEKAGAGSGQDKDYIISKYGQEVYDNQLIALGKVFREQYDRRLMIKGETTKEDEGLVISPVSKFAKEFKIKTLVEGHPFKWKKITAGANKRFGKPDFLATHVNNKDMAEFDELSLEDAFCYWLRTDDTIQFQKGMNYADIIKVYVQSAKAPGTTASKNEDGQYVGAQLILKKKEEAEWERLKSKTKAEGDRLFAIFLEKQLTHLDQTKVETLWNRTFNGYVKINYNKVPVAFPCNKYDMGKPMEIRPEKREAVAFTFSEGSGLLAYDVGVGKTPSAIFTICQFIETGYAKRPVLIVPNQTYKQWISEFKKFARHIRINEFYNLDAGYIDDWKDVNGVTKMVAEGSVSIITYEGMEKLGFNDNTIETLKPEVGAILTQQTEGLSEKKRNDADEKLISKIEELIGRAIARTSMYIEELGFDFISFDEAHACKKVFTSVAGEREENLGNSGKNTQSVSRYKIQSGVPSTRGVKGFMLCQYIQTKFKGNTLLLTATPFTNSPLEVYSMLAMIAHKKLKSMQLDNLTTFFDTFVATSYEMIINAKLKPERRQVILGFNNLISLQTLIRRFMNYKTGEEVNVPRPNKIVLPLRSKLLNGLRVNLSEDEKVETILPLSELQAQLMVGIKQYANGEVSEDVMCSGSLEETEENLDAAVAAGVEIDEDVMTSDEKVGVRMLKAMNHARNLALSPYIFSCSGLGKPTAEQYIKTSNKLNYVMESIRTIKEYHDKEGTDMSGVVIYMDRGVEYFSLIREYLIKFVGFKDHEVGIISSKLITPVAAKTPKDEHKEYVKNLFLGERFNNETLEMEKLSGADRCKVVIGSSTIKEGINLQKHSSVLFNCWMDWNPTDIQQLEGRIYRQGNKFKTVRIVNPLMIDSMDIFMFQKLEEKTSRINTIWSNEGRVNVLKTEEFNPKDLKYSLIKDATVLAEMELLEVGEKINEDIADLENKIKRNQKIQHYAYEVQKYTPKLAEELQKFRPLAEGQPARSLDAMLRLFQDVLKNQLDAQGKKMEHSWSQTQEKKREGFYSDRSPASKPWWFDDLNYANRGLVHETRGYLVPNGITVDDLGDFTKKIEADIEQLKLDKEAVVSEDAIKNKANEIHEQRIADQIEEKTVEQCIADFKKLNYLLSELVSPDKKVEVKTQCPPLDADGNVRIDKEGLLLLEECILHDPDTKRMHTNSAGEYTAERQLLHDKIIAELTGETVCIERGQPIAVLTGGAPGSGKSTFLNKYAPYLQSNFIWKVDADAVRDFFPEYEGWNSQSTHQEARDVVNELITSFDKPCKHDLLYDGTMTNSAKYIPLIRKLKGMGYLVFIAYMDVPKEVSIERALGRYKNNKGGKTKYGRYVPMDAIEDFFKTGKAGLNEIKNSVDGYVVVDSLTQKIVEKGGMNIPQDRDYAKMFDMGAEDKTTFAPTSKVLESRLKLLKRMPATVITKGRIKIVERMLSQTQPIAKAGGGMFIAPRKYKTYMADEWNNALVEKLYTDYYGWSEDEGKFTSDEDLRRVIDHYGATFHQDQNVRTKVKNIMIANGWVFVDAKKFAKGGGVGSTVKVKDRPKNEEVLKNGKEVELWASGDMNWSVREYKGQKYLVGYNTSGETYKPTRFAEIYDYAKGGGVGSETVTTKDGVVVKKRSNEYKGHIFYDSEGNQYECKGYFPKLDDCVYLDKQTGNEVVGCMDGFYYNDPTDPKFCCGGPINLKTGKKIQ